MKWIETVLTSAEIEIKSTVITDGKFDITLRLTELFENQARRSFIQGIQAMIDHIATDKPFETENMINFMISCGYEEFKKEKGKH